MARIFISYKRIDKDKVFKIKERIEKNIGVECWIDLEGVESDAQFANVIIHAIDKCEILLFMFSKSHHEIRDFENDWTIRELMYAADEGKRIVFVNIDGTPLSGWFKFMYGTKERIDGQSDEALFRMERDLRKWLNVPANDNVSTSIIHRNLDLKNLPTTPRTLSKFRDTRTGKYGYGVLGQVIIPARYDSAYEFSNNNTAKVTIDKDTFLIDRAGNIVADSTQGYILSCDESCLFSFDSNWLSIRYNRESRKFGYVNNYDETIIPTIYDSASPFKNRVAKVLRNGVSYELKLEGDLIVERQISQR